jgi:hypothetical protein
MTGTTAAGVPRALPTSRTSETDFLRHMPRDVQDGWVVVYSTGFRLGGQTSHASMTVALTRTRQETPGITVHEYATAQLLRVDDHDNWVLRNVEDGVTSLDEVRRMADERALGYRPDSTIVIDSKPDLDWFMRKITQAYVSDDEVMSITVTRRGGGCGALSFNIQRAQ